MLSLDDLAEAIPEEKKRKTEEQQPSTHVNPLIGAAGKDFVKSRLVSAGPFVTIREIQQSHGVDPKYDKSFVVFVWFDCCNPVFFLFFSFFLLFVCTRRFSSCH